MTKKDTYMCISKIHALFSSLYPGPPLNEEERKAYTQDMIRWGELQASMYEEDWDV